MGKSLKVVALVSGGKDSCYSMLQCVSAGHEIVALANLRPKGQLISEYLFDVLNFPKKQQKIWQISALESKNGQIKKVKAVS